MHEKYEKPKMQEKLGIVEFEDVLLSNVSDLIFTDSFLNKNKAYWDSVVNDLFTYYYYSQEDISIKNLAKSLEVSVSNSMVNKIKF